LSGSGYLPHHPHFNPLADFHYAGRGQHTGINGFDHRANQAIFQSAHPMELSRLNQPETCPSGFNPVTVPTSSLTTTRVISALLHAMDDGSVSQHTQGLSRKIGQLFFRKRSSDGSKVLWLRSKDALNQG
jgi:hypothetical protein